MVPKRQPVDRAQTEQYTSNSEAARRAQTVPKRQPVDMAQTEQCANNSEAARQGTDGAKMTAGEQGADGAVHQQQ